MIKTSDILCEHSLAVGNGQIFKCQCPKFYAIPTRKFLLWAIGKFFCLHAQLRYKNRMYTQFYFLYTLKLEDFFKNSVFLRKCWAVQKTFFVYAHESLSIT